VFVASVVGATALLGVVLLVVKWLEKCCVSASATDDGQEPTTADVLLRAGKRWRRKSKMRRQTGLMSTSSDESKEAEDV